MAVMKARLAAYDAGTLRCAYPLPQPGTTIGRAPDNHILLDDASVSRHHAAVHAKDDMWVIKDLGSKNGVAVNGAPTTHAALKHGDQVRIGHAEFIFETMPDDKEWLPSAGGAQGQRPTQAVGLGAILGTEIRKPG